MFALIAAVACSDDKAADEDRAQGTGGGGGSEELYALATEIETPEGDVLYLGTVSDLSAPFDLLDSGIELPNHSTFQAIGEQVFVAPNDAPTITRYVLDADDRLVRDRTLSFQGVGATSARDYAILSETKAYLFDYSNYKAHVWNPSTMRLTGTEIDLSAARHDDRGPLWLAPWRMDHIRRGDHLLIGGGWWPDDGPAHVSLVLIFDTSADTVRVLEDDRCVNIGGVKQTANGDVFYFAQTYGLVIHESAPCSLVIRDGEFEFDPTFNKNFSESLGGRLPSYFHEGPGNTVYVEVPYEEEIEGQSLEDIYFGSGNHRRLWHLDLSTGEANEVTSIGFMGGARWTFVLGDGRALMPVYSLIDPDDESKGYETDVYEVFEQGEPVEFPFGDDSDEVRARLADIVRLR
jgi:hypothetical protein